MVESESRFRAEFASLLAEEGLVDPEVFAGIELFDEVPIYSRLSQLTFLDHLPIAERNRELIAATVRHLDRLIEHFRSQSGADGRILRMVSVTGWWVHDDRGGIQCTDGASEVLRPNFWIGNLSDERMKNFRVFRPRTDCASFVATVVDPVRYEVFESELTEMLGCCPRRVYVGAAGQLPLEMLSDPVTAGS